MATPKNIILRNLSPSMAKGPSSPIISTHYTQRFGDRFISTGSDNKNPRFSSYINEPVSVGGPGSGTTDTKFNIDSFSYVGSFWIRDQDSSRNFKSLTYREPDGSTNQSPGSLIIGSYPSRIFEYQIPATLSTETLDNSTDFMSKFPESTRLQGPVDITAYEPNNNSLGFLKIVDGRLFCQTYKFYDNSGGADNNIIVFNDPSDIANSSYIGYLSSNEKDRTAHYCEVFPLEWAQSFGKTHFAGVFYDMSIIGRGSNGPSVLGFNPADVTPGDTTITFDKYSHYSINSVMTDISSKGGDYNQNVLDHYETEADMPISSWARVAVKDTNYDVGSNTVSVSNELQIIQIMQKNDSSTLEYIEDYKYDLYNVAACLLLQNFGVLWSTIVVKSEDGNTTYTRGVDYELFFEGSTGDSATSFRYEREPAVFIVRAVTQQGRHQVVRWCYNARPNLINII